MTYAAVPLCFSIGRHVCMQGRSGKENVVSSHTAWSASLGTQRFSAAWPVFLAVSFLHRIYFVRTNEDWGPPGKKQIEDSSVPSWWVDGWMFQTSLLCSNCSWCLPNGNHRKTNMNNRVFKFGPLHKEHCRICLLLTRVNRERRSLRWFVPLFHPNVEEQKNGVKQKHSSPENCNHRIPIQRSHINE